MCPSYEKAHLSYTDTAAVIDSRNYSVCISSRGISASVERVEKFLRTSVRIQFLLVANGSFEFCPVNETSYQYRKEAWKLLDTPDGYISWLFAF